MDLIQQYGGNVHCGTVYIHGTNIYTAGGRGGAGIGGGARGRGGTIYIYDGNVFAIGRGGGAGIGGGAGGTLDNTQVSGGDGGKVNIYGGNVIALGGLIKNVNNLDQTAIYGNGAGIGGGAGSQDSQDSNPVQGGNGGEVNIYGGSVTARGGDSINFDGNDIFKNVGEIDGLNDYVVTSGNGGGAGIGGGQGGNGGIFKIYGGTVNARGGNGGKLKIPLENGNIIESNYKYIFNDDAGIGGAGIGGGAKLNTTGGEGGSVEIYGGTVEATGGDGGKPGNDGGAGIGGSGNGGDGSTLTIEGGFIKANGGNGGAGIGGGNKGNGNSANGSIKIKGGTVIATGGAGGAGIGGGKNGHGGNVTINNGKVTAKGGAGAKGIGEGNESSGSDGSLNLENVVLYSSDSDSRPDNYGEPNDRKQYMWVERRIDSVFYKDSDGNVVELKSGEYTVVDAEPNWDGSNGSWFVVKDAVVFTERIKTTGIVNLILCDSSEFYAQAGIGIENGGILNIYAGNLLRNIEESGKLIATGSEKAEGIGGINCTVNIYSGMIDSTGGVGDNDGTSGVGIGGTGSMVNIYGGMIDSRGGTGACSGAGIGGDGSTVKIYCGNVHAVGGNKRNREPGKSRSDNQ